MPGGIFISYRRDDTRHAAGRLVDRLRETFPRDQLFIDVDNIDLGLDFINVINAKVAACDVMLVVIGPGWPQACDPQGKRRLDDENDFVRLEVEAALTRDVRVIPLLVDGAQPLRADDLPSSLGPLARRQASRLTHDNFSGDVDKLVESLLRVVTPRGGQLFPDSEPSHNYINTKYKWKRVAVGSLSAGILAFSIMALMFYIKGSDNFLLSDKLASGVVMVLAYLIISSIALGIVSGARLLWLGIIKR
jgi:hypothetical protein